MIEHRKHFQRKRAAFAVEFWEIGIAKVRYFHVPNHFFKCLAQVDSSPLCQLSAVLVNGVKVSDGRLYELREFACGLGYYERPPPPLLPRSSCGSARASAPVDDSLYFPRPALEGVGDSVFQAEAARINRSVARAERKRLKMGQGGTASLRGV